MDKELNIVFLDASTVGKVDVISKIEALGSFKSYETTTPEQCIERIRGNNVVIVNKVYIDKDIMDNCPEIELICVTATGVNNIDLEYASKKNIVVKNVAGYSTESVAQTTFSMLFYLLNKIPYFDNYVKSGKYTKSPIFTNHDRTFWEVKGKQFGIIGLGTIGKRVASIAEAFGARVVYHSTSGKNLNNPYDHLSLEELLNTSDIISIHCPLNEDTFNLIGYGEISMMKSHSILLNTGRGNIVNDAALADALNDNIIAAAGIDVLSHEPILENNPLLKVNNQEKILITPHIAWISDEARTKLIEGVYNNIKEWTMSC